MIVSLVQRQTALTAAQKALLQELAAGAEHYFKALHEVEWTVTRERATVVVSVRVSARSGVYRARASAENVPLAARDAMDRVVRQRSRRKRDRVDRRDDHSRKGSGGRR